MSGAPRSKDKPRPSYEDGRLRDPEIERKQTVGFDSEDLRTILRRASGRTTPGDKVRGE